MMNKRIRSMIDAIFAEMKMTAENLALRDELMANAQARFEDAIAQGISEEEAFAQVASSLEDVQSLLQEMNAAPQEDKTPQEGTQEDAPRATAQEDGRAGAEQIDIGDALNRAFSALGNWGQSVMPQAKKIVRDVDEATGGILRDIGRAVNTSVREAQKAAGSVLDKYQQQSSGGSTAKDGKTPETLRDEAQNLRAQADLKKAVGDEEGAAALEAQADALEAQADALDTQADALEQLIAMEQARKAAEDQTAEQAPDKDDVQAVQQDEMPEEIQADAQPDEAQRPIYGADGELDEDAFARSVEQMSREAEQLVREAGDCLDDLARQADDAADKAAETIRTAVCGKQDPQESEIRFPVAGLRTIDVKLDADDVRIEPADGEEIIVRWLAKNVEGVPDVALRNHKLTISRKNPDVFKTFFSVFSKEGGQIVVFVPRGYAADYNISTTSGDIRLSAIDVDDVKISTTSGSVLLEPNAGVRSRDISVSSISGETTISAMAMSIDAQTVSGNLFISCDAGSVHAEGVSGDVHIEGACDSWDVDTVSGDATLICTVVPTGKISVDTLSGDATLSLPSGIRGFAVEFESMNGSLTNEFGPRRYGTCALPIKLNTLSGDMIISRL